MPISPTLAPPYTRPNLRAANSSPRASAACAYSGRTPGFEPVKTQIRCIREFLSNSCVICMYRLHDSIFSAIGLYCLYGAYHITLGQTNYYGWGIARSEERRGGEEGRSPG